MNGVSPEGSEMFDFNINLFLIGSNIKNGKKFLLSYLNNKNDDLSNLSPQSAQLNSNHYKKIINLGSLSSIQTSIWDFTSKFELHRLTASKNQFENAQHVEEDNKENAKLGEVSTKSLSLQSSYSKAEGFMILYELNNRQSFNHIYVYVSLFIHILSIFMIF